MLRKFLQLRKYCKTFRLLWISLQRKHMQIVKPNQTEIKIKKQFNMDADVGNK